MPTVLGILNLSPDSFSDGGLYMGLPAALEHAQRLKEHGADLVDVGAVSSNPDGEDLSPEAEIERLRPVLQALRTSQIPVSVDTFAPATQIWAASQGVAALNDIRGFPDPAVWDALADADCTLIVMYAVQQGRADRRDTDAAQVYEEMLSFFDLRLAELTRAGIAEDRIVVDPGMGFFLGDTPPPSLAVLRGLETLGARTGRPVLVSVSRKSFLGALLGGRPPLERATATVVAELFAALHGADWIRTHDPRALHDALTVWNTLLSPTENSHSG